MTKKHEKLPSMQGYKTCYIICATLKNTYIYFLLFSMKILVLRVLKP